MQKNIIYLIHNTHLINSKKLFISFTLPQDSTSIIDRERERERTYICLCLILVVVAEEDLDGHGARISVQLVLLAVLVIYQVAHRAVKFPTLPNQLLLVKIMMVTAASTPNNRSSRRSSSSDSSPLSTIEISRRRVLLPVEQ